MIVGIILASGYSKRMGKDKLLIEVEGRRIIEWVIKACYESKLDKTILVYRTKEVKELGNKYGIKTIYNSTAYLGQSEGLKLGIGKEKADAYMFLMGDQPFIRTEYINLLIEEHEKEKSKIIIPYYNGKKGTPTIFPSLFKEELMKVKGDKGGREIIEEYGFWVKKVYINDEKAGLDIDTEFDLERIEGEDKWT
ncbi:nucleotidyltransferase family protein [Tissierella sp. MSJ-40]|uniref:Nucleotidyltransferase family protein n=1 Tax=Tissierella simiarum TaxID=2841534 RepID=A0ABS6E4J8_9FIRM|nr:nucleotidyltransferase family protein [Tissierella simiarum]MBU5437183.1 nucleotidyltransferase family protein [Tissierella simiarum]